MIATGSDVVTQCAETVSFHFRWDSYICNSFISIYTPTGELIKQMSAETIQTPFGIDIDKKIH